MHITRPFQILSVFLLLSFLLVLPGPAQAAPLPMPVQADSLVQGGSLYWNTFLGGSGDDEADRIAVDPDGYVYIIGMSSSTWGNPVNPYTGGSGASDVFVAKMDSAGTLVWNTFLGSAASDIGNAITVDSSGNVYVAGYGYATWGDPTRAFVGGADAFVAKLDNSGALLWNTFVGGIALDYAFGIAVDASGNVRVAGSSESGWGSPLNPYAGGADAFVARLNENGSLAWNTFVGTSQFDWGDDIVLDASGNSYVLGDSDATWGSPVIAFSGSAAEFVAKLTSDGAPVWNTFLDRSAGGTGFGIALDGAGNIYTTGRSRATWGSPVNPFTGSLDGFVAKLDSSGSLVWNTFYAGDATFPSGFADIAVDGDANAYVAGAGNATWGVPVRSFTGAYDSFVARIDSTGALAWNTFLGGAGNDFASSIALDMRGNVYTVGGSTSVWGNPINPFASTSDDAFVAKLLTSSKLLASSLLYVKQDTTGNHDGTSWTDAYTGLQAALAAAISGDQIWVAAGTYLPTATTDRTVSFALKDGVAIYGGFTGAAGTEGDFSQRDPAANVTILGGDLGAAGDASDNSYHVVVGSGVSSSAVLDGFTITAGSANAPSTDQNGYDSGGGMYNKSGSPTVANVTFSSNTATWGGGLYNDSSSPALTNVNFSGNTATAVAGGMLNGASSPQLDHVTFNGNTAQTGGGVANAGGSPTLTNVTFSNNTATGDPSYGGGGGMYNYGSSPVLTNVDFNANSASTGGGMSNDTDPINNRTSNPTLTSVTFTGNTATSTNSLYGGGGMHNDFNSSPTLASVTFTGNSAITGGGMHNDRGSSPTLTDVTFSNNTASLDGGGMSNHGNSSPQLTNVTFSDNAVTVIGGGMASDGGNASLTNVTFSGNIAEAGGGMYVFASSPQLTNVTFSGNTSTGTASYDGGGGMYNDSGSTATLNNVTFSGNTAIVSGSAIRNASTSSPSISNSIFWGNGTSEIENGTSTPIIKDSIVAGGCPSGSTCTHVLNADPKLGPLQANGGFTKTRALLPGSAAIDAGGVNVPCAATDQRGITRPQGAACDMGAFELVQYTISGNIGVANGTLTYRDGTLKTATANASGNYSFTVSSGWSGTVTPSKSGYIFTPPYRTYANLTQNQANQNYIAHRLITLSVRSIGSQDGWILESTETSGAGGRINSTDGTFALGDDAGNRQYRAILSFTTGMLPDNAVIQSAVLKIRMSGAPVGSNPFSVLGGLLVDLRKQYFGTSNVLQAGDFNAAATVLQVGTFSSTPSGGWYSVKLNATGLKNLNKLGPTQFRLRFTLDDNNNRRADYLLFFSGNYTTNINYQPTLTIQYYVP